MSSRFRRRVQEHKVNEAVSNVEPFSGAFQDESPEVWAKKISDRIIQNTHQLKEPLRSQALNYKSQIYSVALFYLKEALAARTAVVERRGGVVR